MSLKHQKIGAGTSLLAHHVQPSKSGLSGYTQSSDTQYDTCRRCCCTESNIFTAACCLAKLLFHGLPILSLLATLQLPPWRPLRRHHRHWRCRCWWLLSKQLLGQFELQLGVACKLTVNIRRHAGGVVNEVGGAARSVAHIEALRQVYAREEMRMVEQENGDTESCGYAYKVTFSSGVVGLKTKGFRSG